MAKAQGNQLDPIKNKMDELDAKYGELAYDVAKEILNNIPLTYRNNREVWMRIVNEYKNREDEQE